MGQAGAAAGAFNPGLSWASDIFLYPKVLCLHSMQQGEAVHFPESLTIRWVPSEINEGPQRQIMPLRGEGTTLPLIFSELSYGIIQGLMEDFGP